MAASKPPKHDFAPSWLKIPNQESSKPDRPSSRSADHHHSQQQQHRGRRDDHYRYHNNEYNYPLPRQRSFDSYDDHARPYVHPGHRVNSFEDDYRPGRSYYPPNGYDDVDRYASQYRSHPLLSRSASRDSRDGKYHHHRYGHPQMNGHGYPAGGGGYYNDYPTSASSTASSYHESLHHHGSYTRSSDSRDRDRDRDYYNGYGGRHRSDKHHSGGDYERNKETKKETNPTGNGRTVDEENVVKLDEFPSLNGDADGVDAKAITAGKVTSGNNAWETPPKVQTKSEQSCSPDLQRKDADKASSAIYKALVPKSVNSRKSGRDRQGSSTASIPSSSTSSSSSSSTVGVNVSSKSLTNGKLSSMTNSNSAKHSNARELSGAPSGSTADMLGQRLITTPKTLGDCKKSEFLRTLKQSSPSNKGQDINSNDRAEHGRNDANANSGAIEIDGVGESMDRLNVNSADPLSSSLEAEQRLLREMGWKETDEEDYVITEDDKKAVENQMRQIPARNGGVVKASPLQLKSWSPRHLAFPALTTGDIDVLSSSSYSDSDSD